MSKIFQTALSIAISGLGFCHLAIAPVLAATVNFQLTFFDEENSQIYSGGFSYDDETTLTCFQINNSFECGLEPSEIRDEFGEPTTLTNLVTDFDASIRSFNWTENDISTFWWSDDTSGQLAGEISVSRYGSSPITGRWFFGDPFFGEKVFIMEFTETSMNQGQGTWMQQIVPPGGGDPSFGSGTWEAVRIGNLPDTPNEPRPESVPEPSNFIATLFTMIGLGYYSKQKLNKIKT